MKKVLKEILNWGNTVSVIERPENNSYPKEVIEIHNSFNFESEKLLNEAKKILSRLSINDVTKNKAQLASSFGFNQVREVKEYKEYSQKVEENEKVLNAVMKAIEYIPTAKWIPLSSVERICKQWRLVFGDTSQYKGFLPSKNLQEIQEFRNNHYDKFECITDWYYRGGVSYIFNKQIIEDEKKSKESGNSDSFNHRYLRNTMDNLKICAPLKDMELSSMQQVKDGWRIQDVPDPIVLARHDFNGIEGYFIITAWGDEASDEEVKGY